MKREREEQWVDWDEGFSGVTPSGPSSVQWADDVYEAEAPTEFRSSEPAMCSNRDAFQEFLDAERPTRRP